MFTLASGGLLDADSNIDTRQRAFGLQVMPAECESYKSDTITAVTFGPQRRSHDDAPLERQAFGVRGFPRRNPRFKSSIKVHYRVVLHLSDLPGVSPRSEIEPRFYCISDEYQMIRRSGSGFM